MLLCYLLCVSFIIQSKLIGCIYHPQDWIFQKDHRRIPKFPDFPGMMDMDSQPRRILCAINGSHTSMHAFELALTHFIHNNDELHLLLVHPVEPFLVFGNRLSLTISSSLSSTIFSRPRRRRRLPAD